MRVITIGSDRTLFTQGTQARVRINDYAELFDELHIVVFSLASAGFGELHDGKLHIYPTNSSSRWRYVFDAIRIGKKLPGDVVTAQDPFEAGWVGWRIAKKKRIPLQLQVHTDIFSPAFRTGTNSVRLMVARFLFGEASCIRTISASIREGIEKEYKPHGSVSILPIYVDIEKVQATQPVDIKARYPQFDKIVVSASRLEEEKDPAATIRIFAQVLKKFPNAGLLMLNTGRMRPSLEELAIEFDIAKHVMWEGFSDNPVGYYKSADALIQTSKYEGYGLAVVEALAAGCPVVSTDVGIAKEAGAHVWAVSGLAEALTDVLTKGERGALKFEVLPKHEYLQKYKQLLLTCGAPAASLQ